MSQGWSKARTIPSLSYCLVSRDHLESCLRASLLRFTKPYLEWKKLGFAHGIREGLCQCMCTFICTFVCMTQLHGLHFEVDTVSKHSVHVRLQSMSLPQRLSHIQVSHLLCTHGLHKTGLAEILHPLGICFWSLQNVVPILS